MDSLDIIIPKYSLLKLNSYYKQSLTTLISQFNNLKQNNTKLLNQIKTYEQLLQRKPISNNNHNNIINNNINNNNNNNSSDYLIESISTLLTDIKAIKHFLLPKAEFPLTTQLTSSITIIASHPSNQKILESINKHFEVSNLHTKTGVTCMVKLPDNRIATGSNCSISICNMNPLTKKWNLLTTKPNAHKSWVNYLSKINPNKLASCSLDHSIKIWNVSSYDSIVLDKTINEHTDIVKQVIPLTNDRLASISRDKTIKLWNINTYVKLDIPFEQQKNHPCCIIQLTKRNEMLCVSTVGKTVNESSLLFYELTSPYELKGVVKKAYTGWQFGMVELGNGHVACSSSSGKIIIANTLTYEVVTEISDNDIIVKDKPGTLAVLNGNSFYYVLNGAFCQVAVVNGKYQIVFKVKENADELYGYGLLLLEHEEFFVVCSHNGNNGVNVYECNY